jgi:hypothetical protein
MRLLPRLPLLSVLALLGCTVARPITGVPQPGLDVEATLSSAGTFALASTVGPSAARLDGRVIRASPDSLTVALREVRLRDGQVLFLQGTTVTLAQADLVTLRARTFDRPRSILATTLGLAGAILLVERVRSGGGGDGGNTGGGTNPAVTAGTP